jgi:CRP-like cAMP-binding protein
MRNAEQTRPDNSKIAVPKGTKVGFGASISCVKLVTGWAASVVEIAPGRRQVTAIHLPGDVLIPPVAPGTGAHAGVVALTNLDILPSDRADDATLRLYHQRLVAWLVCVGRRPALSRVAHLLCELQQRIESKTGQTFQMPLLQDDIGDATGVTGVHVNRMLKEIRQRRLASVSFKGVEILNLDGLRELAGFDGSYLRLADG